MRDFIYIYSYLIIAIITFIAPLILFLLSIFVEGISVRRKKNEEKKKQISQLLKNQINVPDENANIDKVIAKGNSDLEEMQEKLTVQLNLLDPKRQTKRIFIPLLSALALVMIDCLIRDNFFKLYNHYLSILLLVLSAIALFYSLFVLKQVIWEIVDVKQQIIADDHATNIVQPNKTDPK